MDRSVKVNLSRSYSLNEYWIWFLGWGIILTILGVLSISYSILATLVSITFLGSMLLVAGIITIIDACIFWWGISTRFFNRFIIGSLYLLIGILFIKAPITVSASLILLFAFSYIFSGALRIFYSLSFPVPRWGWNLFSGVVTILLGGLITIGWPSSSLYILGLFIGIDLFILGLSSVVIALSTRSLVILGKMEL